MGVDGVERISQSSRAGLGESALEEAASQDQVVAAFWDWLNAMTFCSFLRYFGEFCIEDIRTSGRRSAAPHGRRESCCVPCEDGAKPSSLPRWMSIDEPELGLHPKAIRMVAELARFVSRHTQILFATQSSTFLDLFEPEEIVVVEREKGASLLKRLDAADLVG